MSIKSCLDTAEAAGELTGEERDALEAIYEKLVKAFGSADAAKVEFAARLKADAADRKRSSLLQNAAVTRVQDLVLAFRNGRGEVDPAAAMIALLEHHGQVRLPDGFDSVEARKKAIMGLTLGRLEEAMHEFRPTIIAGQTRNTARLENLVHEAAGQDTGDVMAKGWAKIWNDLHEELRQRFNASGGAIAKLDGWFLPQIHDRLALIGAGRDAWVNAIRDRLDVAKMRHPLTGGVMTDADLTASLGHIWDNITSDGHGSGAANAIKPFDGVTGVRAGIGAISNQRTDHRFLVFKGPKEWLDYQAEFGGGADPFKAMMAHVRGMAEDVAAMEILGPNPRSTLTHLQNFVTKQAELAKAGQAAYFPARTEILGKRMTADGALWSVDPSNYAKTQNKLADDMWDLYRGATGAAVNRAFADTMQGVRDFNVASKLGGAVISSLPDAFTQILARWFAGLPVTRTIGDILKQITPGGGGGLTPAARRTANQQSLISETYLKMHNDGARMAAAMHGPAWTRFYAERVMALSGLNAWTDGGRHAFGLSFQGLMADEAATAWAQLHKNIRRTFKRYGLTEKDWDTLRIDPVTGSPRDAMFVKPAEIQAEMKAQGRDGERLAERYLGMILQETEYATPTGLLRARAKMLGNTRSGTLSGEALRSFWQFKSFAVTVGLLHGERVAREMMEQGGWRGAGFAGATLFTFMIGGALTLQIKELLLGKDPKPMNKSSFWLHALVQSGGLGIWGDLLHAETNRFGGGLPSTLAGPVAGLADEILKPIVSNAVAAYNRKPTTVGRDAAKLATQYAPGSSLWYLRTAWSRVFADQIQKQVDPHAYDGFRRKMDTQKKDYGNDFFWKPGQQSPSRGPRLDRVLGAR